MDLRWMAGILLVLGGATASTQDQTTNNGEDLTRPLNRFDVRCSTKLFRYFREEFDNRNRETLTLRSDLVFFRNRTKSDKPAPWMVC